MPKNATTGTKNDDKRVVRYLTQEDCHEGFTLLDKRALRTIKLADQMSFKGGKTIVATKRVVTRANPFTEVSAGIGEVEVKIDLLESTISGVKPAEKFRHDDEAIYSWAKSLKKGDAINVRRHPNHKNVLQFRLQRMAGTFTFNAIQ